MTQSTGMTLDLSGDGKGEEIATGLLPTPAEMGLATDANDHVITDPVAINKVAAALATSEPENDPMMEAPPDTSVRLLAGYVAADGARSTDVEIRDLRGRDEEVIAKAVATGDTGRFIDAVVRCGVVRIGTVEDEKGLRAALDSLLIGDRNLLCMEIRRLAYGDTMELSVVCPLCSHQFGIIYSFRNDVPIKPWAPEGDPETRLFSVTAPSGAVVTIRSIDGTAQKKVFTPDNIRDRSDEERNTLLLAELIRDIDGRAVLGTAQILDQTSRDRRFLLKWIAENQPGPNYAGVMQECPDCQREFALGAVDMYQMFRGA